jgi:hypothetical protein
MHKTVSNTCVPDVPRPLLEGSVTATSAQQKTQLYLLT